MNWFRNILKLAAEHRSRRDFSNGYEFGAGHLLRTNGLSNPMDFIPGPPTSSFDRGVINATEDFIRILECETDCQTRGIRLKNLQSN